MAERKNEEEISTTGEVNAFLEKATSFEGKISFESMLRINGSFRGEIVSGDLLVVAETADVDGQINVNNLLVNGKVNGNVKVKNRIEVTPLGRVRGELQTAVLAISPGATFEGNCRIEEEKAPLPRKTSSLKKLKDEAA
jgi:cytoskeletal protein CcmA (bactofilin family)